MAATNTLAIMDALGYVREDGKRDLATFKRDWSALPEPDKEQIRQGVENGTLTY